MSSMIATVGSSQQAIVDPLLDIFATCLETQAQVEAQASGELETTIEAFQRFINQIEKNYQTLAQENTQLRKRLTLTESQAKTHQRANLALFNSLKNLFTQQVKAKVRAIPLCQPTSAAPISPPPETHIVSELLNMHGRQADGVPPFTALQAHQEMIQLMTDTRTHINQQLTNITLYQAGVGTAATNHAALIDEQKNEISHLKLLIEQNQQQHTVQMEDLSAKLQTALEDINSLKRERTHANCSHT